MAVTKSFKVGTTAVPGNTTSSFDYTVLDTDVFTFSRRWDVIEGVLLSEWAPNLVITDATMTTINKASKSTVYVDATHVGLTNGADGTVSSVVLNDTNVATTDCIIQFNWTDSAVTTALSQGRFYAYDKVNVNNAPANTTVVAFERAASTLRKNRVGGDVSGNAWNASYGVGGRANALSLADQANGSVHAFFLGFSVRPNSYGSSAFGILIEFDVS
jgi:hypothetical protein